MKLSYQDAVRTTSRNKLAKFPDRESGRLEPVASPSFDCGISLTEGARVMTIGSCFARNIEEYLGEAGYDVPVLAFTAPIEEAGARERPQGILNKYTVASIFQEIRWVSEIIDAGGSVSWDLVDKMAYEMPDGRYLDLQLSSPVAVTKERFLERRQQIFDTHKMFFDCDLIIITPGLTEAWFDELTGMFIQNMPDKAMASAHPGRFSFVNIDFHQCYAMLKECADLLLSRGAKQIAFTVSPVPLARTMTSQDILIANMYSKSTIRSAVGLLCQQDDRLKYVPSYERVMLTKSPSVWNNDLRHVAGGFIATIIASFAEGTGRALDDLQTLVGQFNAAFDEKQFALAEELLKKIGSRASASGLPEFHRNAASLLIRQGRFEESLKFCEILRSLRPTKAQGYTLAAKALGKLSRKDEAVAILEEAKQKCDAASQKWIAQSRTRD